MGGQAGNRGYLAQAIIAILDALEDDKWLEVIIEPNIEGEKVDVAWQYQERKRVVQVKSSQNAISLVDTKKWAAELQCSVSADDYELRLIGPVSEGVASAHIHGSVRIPIPLPLNLPAMIEQAAHKLDEYFERKQLPPIRPIARKIVVEALITRISTFATNGTPISRQMFDGMFMKWLDAITSNLSDGLKGTVTPNQNPHELPPPPSDFTGQSTALEYLKSHLGKSSGMILLIRGMGGLGKTSIALKIAADIAHHYDGQIYVDLRGTCSAPTSPEEIMAHVIRSLEPDMQLPSRKEEYASLYRTVLHNRKILLFLENAASEEQLQPVLPTSGSTMLLTSRRVLVLPGLIDYELPMMSREDAVTFISNVAPRVTANEAKQIAELCGCLPLALRVSASAIQKRPDLAVDSYVLRLQDASARLQLIEASIELSVNLLSDETRRCFLALAVFPNTFDLAGAAAIWNIDHQTAADIAGDLLGYSLLTWNTDTRRYAMHDLIRLYMRENIDDKEAAQCHTALSLHYLTVCRAAEQAYQKGGIDSLEGLALFDIEWENIKLGFAFAADTSEKNDEAAQACSDYASDSIMCRELRLDPAEQRVWEGAAYQAALRIKMYDRSIQHLGNLARALTQDGQIDEAIKIQQMILSTAQKVGHHRRDEVYAHFHIGNGLAAKNQLWDAIAEYEMSLKLARSHSDRLIEAHALSNISVAYMRLHEPELALGPATDALGIAAEIDDPRFKAMSLANAANVTIFSNHPEYAVEMYQQAIVIVQGLKDTQNEIRMLRGLAHAQRRIGNEQAALEANANADNLESDCGKS